MSLSESEKARDTGPSFPLGLDPNVDDHTSRALRVAPYAPSVLLGDWIHGPVSLREKAMLWLVNEITDMPGWAQLVADRDVVGRWRAGIGALDGVGGASGTAAAPVTEGPDALPRLPPYLAATGFTPTMFDQVIAELRLKAAAASEDNLQAVRVLDCDAAVYKLTVPDSFNSTAVAALAPLEAEARAIGDYRADHGYAVLNLVHNTMYPVVYGRTRYVETPLTLDTCLGAIGTGEILPAFRMPPAWEEELRYGSGRTHVRADEPLPDSRTGYGAIRSRKLVWLPTDVVVENGKAQIVSYINNLHPVEHKGVYGVVEQVLDAALPAFVSVTEPVQASRKRAGADQESIPDLSPRFNRIQFTAPLFQCSHTSVLPFKRNKAPCRINPIVPKRKLQSRHSREDNDSDPKNKAKFDRTHTPVQPEPTHIPPVERLPAPSSTSRWFPHGDGTRLQILVQINNHILTPDNPTYAGGQWHVEGMLNEHIVASAVYYYDMDNITESTLDFRAVESGFPLDADDKGKHFCGRYRSCLSREDLRARSAAREAIYGKRNKVWDDDSERWEEPGIPPLGGVRARPGRITVFPNVLEHRVAGFELVDKSREGHRKMIAIFLVDPALRVLSSAHVPPQQAHWAAQDTLVGRVEARLPRELADDIYDLAGSPYSLAEAHKFREEMDKERAGGQQGASQSLPVVRGMSKCRNCVWPP